jgi:hypothetical protein
VKLVLRSAICLVVISTLYHAAIPHFPFDDRRGRTVGLAMADRNRARARAYLELAQAPKVVLVGTSISDALGGLPADWYSLAQAGGTPLTGLHIVAAQEPRPEWVFIETNRIQQTPDRELVSELFDPRRKALLEHIPALREHNRPSHVTLLIAKSLRRLGGRAEKSAPDLAQGRGEISARPNRAILRANLELLAKEVPAAQLQARIDELDGLIETLERHGTRVAFFEVPEHPASYATPLRRQLRQSVSDAFQPSNYLFAPTGAAEEFSTRDGVHLDGESGERFSDRLRVWAAHLPGWDREGEDAKEPASIAAHPTSVIQ